MNVHMRHMWRGQEEENIGTRAPDGGQLWAAERVKGRTKDLITDREMKHSPERPSQSPLYINDLQPFVWTEVRVQE